MEDRQAAYQSGLPRPVRTKMAIALLIAAIIGGHGSIRAFRETDADSCWAETNPAIRPNGAEIPFRC